MSDRTSEQWVRDFAARLGLDPPSVAERDDLLELAAVAAHASERTAAPISCWLAARAALAPADALARARELAREAES